MRKKNSSVLQFAPGEVKAYVRKKTRGGTALFRCEKDSPLTRTLQRTFSRGLKVNTSPREDRYLE